MYNIIGIFIATRKEYRDNKYSACERVKRDLFYNHMIKLG